MTRGRRSKDRREPERRCIVTGESGAVDGLIRFVVGPGGDIVPDLAEKLPGRGIWVSAERDALIQAARRKAFSRAARCQVSVAEDLADQVEILCSRRLIELLAMARKAGEVVAGFDKTQARLRAGPVAALIEASDGAENGRAKLRPLAGDAPRIDRLRAAELGLAFGRDHVIHAALDAGGIADRVLRAARRVSGFRPGTALRGSAGDQVSTIRADDRWRTE